MRDFHMPGRSPVRSTGGMVATSHPLATLEAIEVLRSGGNAIDAAICAAAVQAVVEPQSTGLGGDCYALFSRDGTDELIAFEGAGGAPAAAAADWYRSRGIDRLPERDVHTVTVPGAVDAWCRLLADHGRKGIDAVLAPAIRYAEQGYVVHDRVAWDWAKFAYAISDDPHSSRIFLKDGAPLGAGDIHHQPELARTLQAIATGGRDAFYQGEVADDMVARLRELGGFHTADDFATMSGRYVTPVATDYHGHRIHQLPPPNQGPTALVILNILSNLDIGRLDPLGPLRLHLEIEAGRLAFQARDSLIGDPDFATVPVGELLSDVYAADLAATIDPERARNDLPPSTLELGDTVYISVVDRDRNAVSLIASIASAFGSGITSPKTGVLLHNRGFRFRLEEGHPNCLAPGKRPLHTIMPGMVTRGGRAVMPFGVMGGDYQPFGHAHVVANMLDFGMDPQAALDAPRVFYLDGAIEAERGVPEETRAALRTLGHRVTDSRVPLGGGQAIWIDGDAGTLTGASDPRKDGCALGY